MLKRGGKRRGEGLVNKSRVIITNKVSICMAVKKV